MKYRMPILERIPYIVRHAIFERMPIIMSRVVASSDNSVSVVHPFITGCKLEMGDTDCGGNVFDANNLFQVLVIDKGYSKSKILETIINTRNYSKYIRCLTSVPLPKEILEELSYSPHNIVQFSIDPFDNSKEWRNSIFHAYVCGIIVSIFINPVIPTIVKIANLLKLIDSYKTIVNYFCIKFFKTRVEDNFKLANKIQMYGKLIPSQYFEYSNGCLNCSKTYKDKMISIMNMYLRPKKINLVVCGNEFCY